MEAGSHGEVQLENEQFRVTKWTIDPGGEIPMHRHDHDYVVVPLVTNIMHVTTAEGLESVTELITGQSYTRPAGSEHLVQNRGAHDAIEFIEVERLS